MMRMYSPLRRVHFEQRVEPCSCGKGHTPRSGSSVQLARVKSQLRRAPPVRGSCAFFAASSEGERLLCKSRNLDACWCTRAVSSCTRPFSAALRASLGRAPACEGALEDAEALEAPRGGARRCANFAPFREGRPAAGEGLGGGDIEGATGAVGGAGVAGGLSFWERDWRRASALPSWVLTENRSLA